MPNAKAKTHGLKAVIYEGNHIWNSLPMQIFCNAKCRSGIVLV